MPINKIKYGNNTLIDLTDTTATASEVLSGYSFHDKTGALVQGSKTIDLTTVTVTPTNTTQVIVPGDEYYLNIENMAPTSTSGSGTNPGTFWNISWSTQLNAGEIYHVTLDFYRSGYTRHYVYDDDITFNGFPFNITASSTSSSHNAIIKFNTTQISNSLVGDEDTLIDNRLTVSVFKESTAIGYSQVIVNGDADLISSNIKKDVNIFGVVGTYEASGVIESVTQDQDGYVILDNDEGNQIIVDELSVTQNGTYTAPTGHAYSPVEVNVSGGGGGGSRWVRPSEWPDLSKMDVSSGDILYMTSYADDKRGFCSFYVTCRGSYTVDVGTISGTTFTSESTQTYASNDTCNLYYGSANGTYKVLRVTGSNITKLYFYNSNAITIDAFNGYTAHQGIIDIVGRLPMCNYVRCNLPGIINAEISGLVLSGNAGGTFQNCYSLASLDVSGWNTSAVTNMSNMFQNCYLLTSLDVSGWNTSAVTNMSGMFSNCNSLTSLDLSGWNTSSVTSMSSMFNYCYSLTSLNVSGWDTSKVIYMTSMFNYCNSLTSLDVSEWNTSAVTNMADMFSNCSSLTSLDVSEWNTSAVDGMSSMFNACYSLTLLDVSRWDTSKVSTMSNMFNYCRSLTSLDVSRWDTSKVTGTASMFNYCFTLASLDVSGWNTSKVSNMSSMFNCCYSLTSLDLSGWDLSLLTNVSYAKSIFYGCHGLHGSMTLPSTMTVIGSTCFYNCRSLYEWHFLATTPPTLNSTDAFSTMTDFGGKKIYVPQGCLSAYQSATNWSTYASYMIEEQ